MSKIKSLFNILVNIVKDIIQDDLGSISSEMAFNLILTISPFMISIVAIFGLLSSSNIIDQIIDAFRPITPPDALNILNASLRGINQSSSGGILTFGFLSTLWAITGLTDVIIKGLNRAYKLEETRPIWITKGLAVFLVLLTVIVLFVSINLIIFVPVIIDTVSRYIHISGHIHTIILLSRWPITFLALFTMMVLIYAFMPDLKDGIKCRISYALPGTIFFCIFWTIASWGFGVYAENYGGFNQVYGALGAVIILLTWLYYTSFILLIGGEINSEIFKNFHANP